MELREDVGRVGNPSYKAGASAGRAASPPYKEWEASELGEHIAALVAGD